VALTREGALSDLACHRRQCRDEGRGGLRHGGSLWWHWRLVSGAEECRGAGPPQGEGAKTLGGSADAFGRAEVPMHADSGERLTSPVALEWEASAHGVVYCTERAGEAQKGATRRESDKEGSAGDQCQRNAGSGADDRTDRQSPAPPQSPPRRMQNLHFRSRHGRPPSGTLPSRAWKLPSGVGRTSRSGPMPSPLPGHCWHRHHRARARPGHRFPEARPALVSDVSSCDGRRPRSGCFPWIPPGSSPRRTPGRLTTTCSLTGAGQQLGKPGITWSMWLAANKHRVRT
jgi:hypothetical protein